MKHFELDPHTASVGFLFEQFGVVSDGDDRETIMGRVYYWYEPEGTGPVVEDADLCAQHLEIPPEPWRQLFCAAFDRGQRAFLLTVKREYPAMFRSEKGLRHVFVGYQFGPCPPSRETLEALGLPAYRPLWSPVTVFTAVPETEPDERHDQKPGRASGRTGVPVALSDEEWRDVARVSEIRLSQEWVSRLDRQDELTANHLAEAA
jgi:hypothetical protein